MTPDEAISELRRRIRFLQRVIGRLHEGADLFRRVDPRDPEVDPDLFEFIGQKPPLDVEEALQNAVGRVWHLRDCFHQWAKASGKTVQDVDAFIRTKPDSLCVSVR